MPKQMMYGDAARSKIQQGLDQLADAVKVTLGPKGRNVVFDKGYGSPTITKDGVTVAKEVELEDIFENMGAQMARDVASKTSDVAGDGTTTATVLAQAIYKEGIRYVTAGVNPMALKRGIDKAVRAIVRELRNMTVDTDEHEQIAQVATISTNGDQEIGDRIAEAMEKVGRDGIITIEDSNSIETELELVEGMQFDKGYISAIFSTNLEKMTVEYDNPFILMVERTVSIMKDLLPILEHVIGKGTGRPIVIIADDVAGDALASLVVNQRKGIIKTVAVRTPGYGDRKKPMLEDLAILTGGKVVSNDTGLKLEKMQLEDLGQARRVIITKDTTTIVDGRGKPEEIEARVEHIKSLIEDSSKDFDKSRLQERLAKLSGGVAVLRIGSVTEVEMKEKKARVEDALHATRAAVAEGIVAGGGTALIRAQRTLTRFLEGAEANPDLDSASEDEKTGIRIVEKAIEAPLYWIATNAGANGSIVVEKVKAAEGNTGYNAETGEYLDMIEKGIIDPTKVTRSALQNAGSVAGLMLTTECVIALKKEEEPKIAMSSF